MVKMIIVGIAIVIPLAWFFQSIPWLLVLQITGAGLWLSTFGYVLTLIILHRNGRPIYTDTPVELPPVAVVVPVRNEAELIEAKIHNLLDSTYPQELLRIIIADGGSTDETLDIAGRCRALHPHFDVFSVPHSQARSDQLNHVLGKLECEYVVFTDADSLLTPDCITHLIHDLISDRSTAVVGAQVEPITPLLEEKLHWWFLNRIWRLEGEVLRSSMVSGVCYACRVDLLPVLPDHISADDVYFTLNASLKGYSTRLSAGARAFELRTPSTATQLIAYRRRRGSGYLKELKRSIRAILTNLPHSWAALIRLWHFQVTPIALMLFLLAALVALASSDWPWVLYIMLAMMIPYLALLHGYRRSTGEKTPWPQLVMAGIKLVLANLISAFSLPVAKPGDTPTSCKVD